MWGACAGASSLLICAGPAGSVRARQSGKPMNSVFERELRAGKKDDGGPAAGRAADFFHIYINYFVFKVVK